MPKGPLWGKIWNLRVWPKVALFLWLLCHQSILTWDNLRKRHFHCPSICPNCGENEETQQHLLYACPLASLLWEKVSFRCQRNCKPDTDIRGAIRDWHQHPFKSGILNHLWRIIPGLLLWTIWKERNKRIFKDQRTSIDIIWSNFCLNLTETLALQSWSIEDYPTLAKEKAIWENWGLQTQPNI